MKKDSPAKEALHIWEVNLGFSAPLQWKLRGRSLFEPKPQFVMVG